MGYDPLHRLASDELKTPGGTSIAKIAYEWDLNGNEKKKTTTGFAGCAVNQYTYDLANRLKSWDNGVNPVVYDYDNSGNRIQAGAKLFTYDERNQLTTASGTAAVSYAYTPRGTLSSTTVIGVSTVATQADAYGQIASQYTTPTAHQDYVYDALGRSVRPGASYTGLGNTMASDATSTYTRDPSGGLLGAAQGTTTRTLWTDLHTDVVGQFDPTAATLAGSTAYEPLGKVIAATGMIGTLGYQSEWTDNLTGRVNMAARWYNTDTGQFDTRDTIAVTPVPSSITANRFAYGDANPLVNTDPTGHWPNWLDNTINKAGSAVSATYNAGKNLVVNTYNTVKNKVVSTYHDVANYASEKLDDAKAWAKEKRQQARDVYDHAKNWTNTQLNNAKQKIAQKIDQAKQVVKKTVNTAVQAGKRAITVTTRVIASTATIIRTRPKRPGHGSPNIKISSSTSPPSAPASSPVSPAPRPPPVPARSPA